MLSFLSFVGSLGSIGGNLFGTRFNAGVDGRGSGGGLLAILGKPRGFLARVRKRDLQYVFLSAMSGKTPS